MGRFGRNLMRLQTAKHQNLRRDNSTSEALTHPASPFLTCTLPENLQTTLPLPPLTLRYKTTLGYRCGERIGCCHLRLFWPT